MVQLMPLNYKVDGHEQYQINVFMRDPPQIGNTSEKTHPYAGHQLESYAQNKRRKFTN